MAIINGGTFKTKTFWGALATIATGIGLYVTGNKAEGIQTIIIGVLAIFGRDALTKIVK